MRTLLVANRGEVAVRIMRAAAELGVRTVAVFSSDDAGALHTRRADAAQALPGVGAAAYLDVDRLLAAAAAGGCDAIHPGYGFVSESAAFARRVAAAGMAFVGPRPDTLALLGDKLEARRLAERCGVPVLRATAAAVGAEEAAAFLAALGRGGAVMLKAVAGGGGRGMRVVRRRAEIADAHARCRSEALHAFGNGDVYVEQLMARARHVEVQVVGDGSAVTQLGERECSIQRRHQKLVEIAPCPSLSPRLRERLIADAVRLAEALGYLNAGTFEFLVDAADANGAYAFIEANPRLQVEHTVTEAVLGIDLVAIQLQLAAGRTLGELGLRQDQVPAPRGFAVQVRVNSETMSSDGVARPGAGTVTAFEPPAGPGLRTDTAAHVGYRTNSHFDSLLAKVIAHSTSPRFADAAARATRALQEFTVEGVPTNIDFLRRVLEHPDFVANRIDTGFVDTHLSGLTQHGSSAVSTSANGGGREGAAPSSPPRSRERLDPADPLAILAYGKSANAMTTTPLPPHSGGKPPHSTVVVSAPMQGTVVSLMIREGDTVRAGQALLVMNAMKMEHVVEAPAGGVVRHLVTAEGDTVAEGRALVYIEPGDQTSAEAEDTRATDLDHVRADLGEALGRRALTRDAARADAVTRRHASGQRTARENIADLCDPDSFVEYGGLAIAAQRQRRSLQDLIERTPADGLVAGIGRVNGDLFDESRSRCAVLSYDYTVLAGTQGFLNHRKKDRLFELAERLRIPVVFFTEGGGGRPGDTDAPGVAGLDCMAFHLFGRLSGLVPLVGINSGRCFAGNAALLGSCDVVIATANSNIGMGGPAMIEGGGLGVFRPEEVGPMDVQVPNGVVDVPARDEAEAVRIAKQYLAYFQGPLAQWQCADQRRLRGLIPENRLRVYDVRAVIATLADSGSVLELRRAFGAGMVTALIRVEGRPLGVIANNPTHLAGAIDSPGADKAARFMQLCDAFDIPLLCLCDTPGMMVGPQVETTALVRHCCRMFVVGASLTVPVFTIVLRKGYGLGAQAMAAGSFKAPLSTVAWPTGEFGGMGLEGAVKLGFRKELAAIDDAEERRKLFEHMVGRAYEHGKALNSASHFEIDDVIDPAESRQWLMNVLRAVPAPLPRTGKKRPCIDTW
jgi:acetyl/propionyl-CoA carboxylase alpha subunit/acetyl-CoA carboxylase carboxyltransferase component